MAKRVYARFIILRVFEADELTLARVRSLVSLYYYIEVAGTFYISCAASLLDSLSDELARLQIKNCLVYVEKKAGANFTHVGLSAEDADKLTEIIRS